jgi:hypothetical protein
MVVYDDAKRLRAGIKLARESGAAEGQIAGVLGITQASLAKLAPKEER